MKRTRRLYHCKRRHESPHTVGVMSNVEKPAPPPIEPARNFDLAERALHLESRRPVRCRQGAQDAVCHRGISSLVRSCQTEWTRPFVIGWDNSDVRATAVRAGSRAACLATQNLYQPG